MKPAHELFPFYYGWVVVAGAFVVMFLGFGAAYSIGAFFRPLELEFQATRAGIAFIFSIAGFLYFLLGAVSGGIADRFGPRLVILAGMVLIALGLLLASRATTLWQVYLTYGLCVGLGIGASYVPSIGVVQHWFVRRRGLASGLAVAGIGAGTLVMPPVVALLIDLVAWRATYVILAAGVLVAGGLAVLAIERRPEDRGLAPDGDPPRPDQAAGVAAPPAGASIRQALGSRPFLLLFSAALVSSFGLFIPFVHITAYGLDHGLTERAAVGLVSLIGLGSVAGRFLLGAAADRIGRQRAMVLMFAGLAAMLIWWLFATSFWSLAAFAVLFGTFYGGFVALAPALTADYFGARNISAIIGLLYSGVGIGTLVGPVAAGWAYDLSQSYILPIVAGAALNVVSTMLVLLAPTPAAWRRSHPECV